MTSRLAPLTAFARRHPSLAWVMAVVGPGLLGYLFTALVLFPAPIFASSRTVPRVIGLALSDAEQTLNQANLDVGTTETLAHPTAARGVVVWQDPPPQVAVPEGTPVRLGVSGGPQRVPVPDLTGYDAPLAGQLVQASGLTVGRIDSTQAPVPKGVVVNTRPPAGTPLSPGTGITLVVSVGAPTISVPNLIGLSIDDARAALEEVGLTLGTSIYRTSQAGAPGTVIQQNPQANTLAAAGTAIDVTVARRRQ